MFRQWERSIRQCEHGHEEIPSACMFEFTGDSKLLNGASCLFQCNEASHWSGIIFGRLTKVQSTLRGWTNGGGTLARSSPCAYYSVTLSLLRRLTSIKQIRSECRAPVTRAARGEQSRGGSVEHRNSNADKKTNHQVTVNANKCLIVTPASIFVLNHE